MEVLSFIGDGPLYWAAIFIIWLCCSISRQYYYLFACTFSLSIVCIAKLVYSEARPYFVDADIKPLGECTADFANPSGHTNYVFVWALILYLDVVDSYAIGFKNLKAVSVLAFIILPFCFLNAFSRLYVGVHALNQIVFGAFLGIFCAFLSHFIVRKPLMRHIEKLLKAKKEDKFTQEVLMVIICTLLHMIMTFVPFLVHERNGVPEIWKKNLCQNMNVNKVFHRRVLNDSMFVYEAPIAYAGIYLLRGLGIQNKVSLTFPNLAFRFLALSMWIIIPFSLMFFGSSNTDYPTYLFKKNFLPAVLVGCGAYFVLPLFYLGVSKISTPKIEIGQKLQS